MRRAAPPPGKPQLLGCLCWQASPHCLHLPSRHNINTAAFAYACTTRTHQFVVPYPSLPVYQPVAAPKLCALAAALSACVEQIYRLLLHRWCRFITQPRRTYFISTGCSTTDAVQTYTRCAPHERQLVRIVGASAPVTHTLPNCLTVRRIPCRTTSWIT